MYDVVTTPRGPNPIEVFKGPIPPALGNWIEHRSRRKREAEVFQDLQRHPWVGVRQAGYGRAAQYGTNLYGMTARAVDTEIRKVPYEVRLHNPPAGTFPLVVGEEMGTGPGPWWDSASRDDVDRRARGRAHWESHNEWDNGNRTWKQPARPNQANRKDGPGN